ncbi:insulin-like growth factor binding protein [Flammula alnicola]|nr:insulin-like growth factor binding protein [Flammula alnicola]
MMLSMLLFVLYFAFSATVFAQSVAQSSLSVVCVAGQCLQGLSNTTIGAKLSASGASTSVQLLPGQYTATTNPQLLHNLLTSASATLATSPGFGSTNLSSLPLNLNLEPGLAIYSLPLYSGQAAFSQLPSSPLGNNSTPLAASSIALSTNVWAAVTSGSSNDRIVVWDAIPDISQLPSAASRSLSLVDIQSSACSPACSGAGVCSASGTCTCPTGFAGSSCETCAAGFFGPTCQPCPAGCPSCDQGMSGSGRCLVPVVANAPSTCNCLNGQCGANGQCACNPGWTTATNGTACATCAPGFFLTSTGDCQVCQLGCTQCADTTGACISCKQGFTQDANDKTKCDALPSTTTSGTVCPDGSFSAGATCSPCSPSCRTCNGPSSNNCILCAAGQYSFNGNCVGVDTNGVCQGSNGMIADNNKNECDSCGAKCTSCKIPNFNVASTVNQLQCTGCLPGSVLSQGQCIGSCPTGTFVSPQDNITCTACSSSCGTCVGSADFCLTCPSGQLASSGQCVSTCPSNTFSSSGSCVKCHPDCATCSGPSFNQCASCPAGRPVLTNGRCLPTCAKSQFFDKTSASCQPCDSSCSSCSASGPGSCLACSSSTEVLRAGSCVAANCASASSVIPGLGVCLSELVQVPTASGRPRLRLCLPLRASQILLLSSQRVGLWSGGRSCSWRLGVHLFSSSLSCFGDDAPRNSVRSAQPCSLQPRNWTGHMDGGGALRDLERGCLGTELRIRRMARCCLSRITTMTDIVPRWARGRLARFTRSRISSLNRWALWRRGRRGKPKTPLISSLMRIIIRHIQGQAGLHRHYLVLRIDNTASDTISGGSSVIRSTRRSRATNDILLSRGNQ